MLQEVGDPYRIRTDVNGVRGRCLNHLTNGPLVHLHGLEPGTHWLRVSCSTNWAKGADQSNWKLKMENWKLVSPSWLSKLSIVLLNFNCSEYTLKTEHCFLSAISGLVNTEPALDQAFGLLVSVSLTHYCAYTSDLSTSSSTTCLSGDLILGRVSRLDAFSVYLVRT